jgi:hypothetical protein
MPAPATDATYLWDQLLEFIEEQRVVPIVGQDLLTVEWQGRAVLLYRLLAERLAGALGVSSEGLDEGRPLNTVVCRHLAERGDLEDVYSALKSAMPPAGSLAPPEPLVKLAAIRPLRLFVTTTFDPLLEQALNDVRFAGERKTRVAAYSPSSWVDLPADLAALPGPLVYHLLGQISAVPDCYAVTDEDLLEFMHSLQASDRRPPLLFDELRKRHLLVIGSSFSGWLARFFIRIAKGERLARARMKTDMVADQSMQEDTTLVHFLRHFSTRTKLFPGGAAPFVDELHRRWTERHPPSAHTPEAPAPVSSPTPDMARDAVFLSYASEDLAIVSRIKEALEGAGVDAWFDKRELTLGDDWDDKIQRNIRNCSFFIPVISRNTVARTRGYFWKEWRLAERVAMEMAEGVRFILPVAIDDTTATEPTLLESFRKTQWTRLPEGNVTAEFVASVRSLYREYQKERTGG